MDKFKFRVALLKGGGWEVEQIEDWGKISLPRDKYRFITNTSAEDAEEALSKGKRARSMVNTVSLRARNKERLNG